MADAPVATRRSRLKTGYNLCDASMHYGPDFVPVVHGEGIVEWKIEDSQTDQ